MEDMNITSAKYLSHNGENVCIEFVLDGVTMHVSVGITGNRHFDEIMKQVEAKELTIADAE